MGLKTFLFIASPNRPNVLYEVLLRLISLFIVVFFFFSPEIDFSLFFYPFFCSSHHLDYSNPLFFLFFV